MLKSKLKMLSGGELQLLSLIRSMIIEPSILYMMNLLIILMINNIELVTNNY